MTVADKIKRLRKEKGMTQKQLAQKCGMSESALRQYEIGYRNPKIKTVRKIAEALGISIFQLTDGDYSYFTADELKNDFFDTATPLTEFNQQLLEKATAEESSLLTDYRCLNSEGRTEARKRVQELTEIPRYTETPQLNAAHADDYANAPEELKKLEEAIMDDENF